MGSPENQSAPSYSYLSGILEIIHLEEVSNLLKKLLSRLREVSMKKTRSMLIALNHWNAAQFFTILIIVFHILFSFLPLRAQSVPNVSDLLDEIQRLSQSLGEDLRIQILPTTAFLYAQLGDTEAARTLFQKAADHALQRFSPEAPHFLAQPRGLEYALPSQLRHIASLQSQAQDIMGGKATMTRSLSFLKRNAGAGEEISPQMISLFRDAAIVQGRLGDVSGARSTLAYVVDWLKKERKKPERILPYRIALDLGHTYLDLANAYLDLGESSASWELVHQSLTTAQTLPSGHWVRKHLLQRLPAMLAKLGKLEELQDVLQSLDQISDDGSIHDQQQYVYAHLESAKGLWEAGEQKRGKSYMQTARSLVLAMNDTVMKSESRYASEIWSRLAVTEAELGLIEQAFDAEAHILLEDLQGHALLPIMEWHLRRGEFQMVRRILQEASPDIVAKIIVLQVNAGDLIGAIESFEILHRKLDSLKLLPKYFPPEYAKVHHRDFLLSLQAVGRARVNAWGAHRTLQWAQTQRTSDLKAFALLGVAEGMISKSQDE